MTQIRTIKALEEKGLVSSEERLSLEKVVQQFSLSLTPHITHLLESRGDAGIAKQFIPAKEELNIQATEHLDPIGDGAHTTVKGVVHRARDRCLLMPVTTCPVYCRFCFRREQVGKKEGTLSKAELKEAYRYIGSHPEIWEVILTGGDPLILKPKSLQDILEALDRIPHVEIVRIHTRIPTVDPERITADLINVLKASQKTVYVVLHTNHPSELNDAAQRACARLVDQGIPMLSQTVLLKGINDTPEVMAQLMRALVRNRVKPYYLHQADLAQGTSHFRTSLKTGQALVKWLREHCSGLCQPTYMLDIPGGFGKVPIGATYLEEGECSYRVQDYEGRVHQYSPENIPDELI